MYVYATDPAHPLADVLAQMPNPMDRATEWMAAMWYSQESISRQLAECALGADCALAGVFRIITKTIVEDVLAYYVGGTFGNAAKQGLLALDAQGIDPSLKTHLDYVLRYEAQRNLDPRQMGRIIIDGAERMLREVWPGTVQVVRNIWGQPD